LHFKKDYRFLQVHHNADQYPSFFYVIHFAIKRRRDIVKKKIENVNEDTIGNEIVTSDQPVNAMQGTFL
jgi:hypothetical protein